MFKGLSQVRTQLIISFSLAIVIVAAYGFYSFSLASQASQILHGVLAHNQTLSGSEGAQLDALIQQLLKASFIFLSVGIVVFSAILVNLLFTITPALRLILGGINEVVRGNLKYRIRLQSHNEFGSIAGFFNQAIAEVEQLHEELKKEKAGVERQVDDRTQELSREKARFLASINSLPLGFIMTNVSGAIHTINPAMQHMLDLRAGDLSLEDISKRLEGRVGLLEELLTQAAKCVKKKSIITLNEINDNSRIYRALIAPVLVPHTKEIIGTAVLVEDVTEERVMARSKDEFFSIASHELRTPLTAIRGNTSMIEQFYTEQLKDKELHEMVGDIHDSSVRLIQIVNDFLDMSRIEQGKMKFDLSDFDMQSVVHDVFYDLGSIRDQKHIFLKSELDKGLMVHADKSRITQVVYNLVGNAMRFVETGGITISGAAEGKLLKVSITDTGRGISPEGQQLLFHKFQQANNNILTRDDTRGTGLGLYISRLLVEHMGGKIALERSEVGKGSTFSFTVPLVKKK
ncbi:MAG: Na+/proline symporter [Patescibacteria group bacterium]|nr:Na+/proline symporter [Patescibacteria group bacterium]